MARYWAGWWERMAPGLSALACGWGLGPCVPVPEARGWAEPGPAVLPPAHPERPAGHVPPTDAERALWRQLDGVGSA
ncbi:DUF6059 family protein [Kitasatospora sp. NPDC004745]|uniref:DUF6059 family protein n=1 Tax=Kitasatospora sp. NPDC004745 TaxID=3364019 RepID=UPI00368005A6